MVALLQGREAASGARATPLSRTVPPASTASLVLVGCSLFAAVCVAGWRGHVRAKS